MNLRRVVPPATTPISLAEAKAHLRVTGTAEDALIASFVQAATDHLDGWAGILGRALVAQTWDLYLDAFPPDAIEIPLGPLSAVDQVSYLHPATRVMTPVPADAYSADTFSPTGWVVLNVGASWPDTLPAINAVRVRFVAGYGAADAVPAAIKAAILLIVGDLYEHREAQGAKGLAPNATVDRLLAPYRILTA